MGKIYCMFNQKGGVGKTTSCANLCAAVAMKGKTVLAVDFDAQSNLTSGLNIDKRKLRASVYNVLMGDSNIKEVIVPTDVENLWVLPATIDLSGAEVELANIPQREIVLRNCLREVVDDYDYIIIDCPPSLGLLSINGLTAADGVDRRGQ